MCGSGQVAAIPKTTIQALAIDMMMEINLKFSVAVATATLRAAFASPSATTAVRVSVAASTVFVSPEHYLRFWAF